jgi:hypothetical protein
MNTPLTGIETVIAEALTSTMTGTEFAEALDKAGITITQVTASDERALDALRAEAELARGAAHTNEANILAPMEFVSEARHFASVKEGDYAAVTRKGDVFRLNPTALDFEEAEQRLADVQSRLPSVVEVRALNEINRERVADERTDRRKDYVFAATLGAQNRSEERELREHDRAVSGAASDLADTTGAAADRATHAGEGVLRGLGKIFASFVGWLADSIAPPPPPTRDQAERMARSSEEKQDARVQQDVQAEREAQHWLIIEAQRQAERERGEAAESEQQHARRREQDRSYERDL